MFEMRVSDAIYSIVEAMFPMPKGEGLFVMLDLRMEHPKDKRNRAFGNVCFVFERPHNYCKVFAAVTHEGLWDEPKIEAWQMMSDHDSCWRTDGVERVVDEEYFRQASAISETLAPMHMKTSADIHRIDRVKLEYEVVDPSDSHMKRLTKLEFTRK